MKKTNFDLYLFAKGRELERDIPGFARAGEPLGKRRVVQLLFEAGLSQKDLARKLKTSQQQISRLESPSYEGHSLSMLRRVAKALSARVRVVLEPVQQAEASHLAESPLPYRVKRPHHSRS